MPPHPCLTVSPHAGGGERRPSSQRRLRELQQVGGGGERKFSQTFFPLKGLWRSSVRFSEEGDPRRKRRRRRKKENAKGYTSVKKSIPSSVFVSSHERKKGRECLSLSCVSSSFPDWEDLHHQRRWDVSELCLVEMDRLYPSENMASASRGLASCPVCLWRSAAWRRGAPGRRGTAAGAAAPVPLTAAARWRGPSRPASSTAPTSGWRGPQQRRTSRWPPACCKYCASTGMCKFHNVARK